MGKTKRDRKVDMDQLLIEEEKAFARLLPRLLRSHEGEYGAIHQGKVVGHSKDDEELAHRMFARFGDELFLIAHVVRRPNTCDFPSPELEPEV